MKFLANENFPIASVRILENAGYDIKYIGIDHAGVKDSEVMDIAINEKRTILTFDRDYGELIFKKGYKPTSGVIYIRWDSFRPNEPGEYLMDLFESTDMKFEKMLTIISKSNIRQRKF